MAHKPVTKREYDEVNAPLFVYDPDCHCVTCREERDADLAFQLYAVARLGRALSKAQRTHDSQHAYLAGAAARALEVWPIVGEAIEQ